MPSGPHVTTYLNQPYTIHISPSSNPNLPAVGFSSPTQEPGDNALDIRIRCNALVMLNLDTSNCDWEFVHTNGIDLGVTTSSYPGNRYFNLTSQISANGRCVSVSFEAKWLTPPTANFANKDPYNLYFVIYTIPDSGGVPYSTPLELTIDPDIQNPGNDGLIVGIKQ